MTSAIFATEELARLLPIANQIELGFAQPDYAFDEFIQAPVEATSAVIRALDKATPAGARARARNSVEIGRFPKFIGLITANAIVSAVEGRPCRYSRSTSNYRGVISGAPSWLTSRPLIRNIDAMERAGLLSGQRGKAGPGGGPQSTFWATDKLACLLTAEGTNDLSAIIQEPERPMLILKDEAKRSIAFTPTKASEAAASAVRRYNVYVDKTDISALAPNGILRRRFHRPLYRIFNNSSWTQGGRFYGGWWQTLPKTARSDILIGGEPTIELDFSGFTPRALYHLAGIEYLGDPYEIPEVKRQSEIAKLDWATVRSAIKVLFLFLLNSSHRRGASGVQTVLGKSMRNTTAIRCIKEHHALIAEYFHNGAGLEMMALEADVCERIICAGVENDICILPIHDSFIVSTKHIDWLHEVMSDSYRHVFGFLPIIKQSI